MRVIKQLSQAGGVGFALFPLQVYPEDAVAACTGYELVGVYLGQCVY